MSRGGRRSLPFADATLRSRRRLQLADGHRRHGRARFARRPACCGRAAACALHHAPFRGRRAIRRDERPKRRSWSAGSYFGRRRFDETFERDGLSMRFRRLVLSARGLRTCVRGRGARRGGCARTAPTRRGSGGGSPGGAWQRCRCSFSCGSASCDNSCSSHGSPPWVGSSGRPPPAASVPPKSPQKGADCAPVLCRFVPSARRL